MSPAQGVGGMTSLGPANKSSLGPHRGRSHEAPSPGTEVSPSQFLLAPGQPLPNSWMPGPSQTKVALVKWEGPLLPFLLPRKPPTTRGPVLRTGSIQQRAEEISYECVSGVQHSQSSLPARSILPKPLQPQLKPPYT